MILTNKVPAAAIWTQMRVKEWGLIPEGDHRYLELGSKGEESNDWLSVKSALLNRRKWQWHNHVENKMVMKTKEAKSCRKDTQKYTINWMHEALCGLNLGWFFLLAERRLHVPLSRSRSSETTGDTSSIETHHNTPYTRNHCSGWKSVLVIWCRGRQISYCQKFWNLPQHFCNFGIIFLYLTEDHLLLLLWLHMKNAGLPNETWEETQRRQLTQSCRGQP